MRRQIVFVELVVIGVHETNVLAETNVVAETTVPAVDAKKMMNLIVGSGADVLILITVHLGLSTEVHLQHQSQIQRMVAPPKAFPRQTTEHHLLSH